MNSKRSYMVIIIIIIVIAASMIYIDNRYFSEITNLEGAATTCDEKNISEELIENDDDTLTVIETNTCNSCITIRDYSQDGALIFEETQC